jgi:hypothetical protein
MPVMSFGARGSADSVAEAMVGLHQIMPCQYFDLSAGHRLTGEQRLMLALLADAINVYQQGVLSRSTRKRLLYVDAERWIMAGDRANHAFSFETVCDALEINPSVLRRRMVVWKHTANRTAEVRATPHLRLKITPRTKRMTHRRNHSRPQAPAF